MEEPKVGAQQRVVKQSNYCIQIRTTEKPIIVNIQQREQQLRLSSDIAPEPKITRKSRHIRLQSYK